MKKYILIIASALIMSGFVTTPAMAHQPVVVEKTPVIVLAPEVSKAYYSELNGSPQTYHISSSEPFNLSGHILLPVLNIYQPVTFFTIEIKQAGQTIFTLDNFPDSRLVGDLFPVTWFNYLDYFSHDRYRSGLKFNLDVEAGEYDIIVSNGNQPTKYALVIGKKEIFGIQELWSASQIYPQLKRDFFFKSPIDYSLSVFGMSYILIMLAGGFALGFGYRYILKKIAQAPVRKVQHNIGLPDRLLRLALGLALFFFAIITSWSPLLLIGAGLCFFEAIFSWCGFYAAIGRNSCPLN